MGKTAENIEYYLDPKNDKDYLQDLFLNIKTAYENQKKLNFKIVEIKEKGFLVKASGLFAYVSFLHMPWEYPSVDYWHNISDFLIGKVFKGKVYDLKENPISIILDGKVTTFEKPKLTEFKQYKGIVLHKAKYGLFIDIGYHFNWKYGSLFGLIHKSSMAKADYASACVGTLITTTFCDYNYEGKLILGDNRDRIKWMTKELQQLIGTIQKVKVIKNKDKPVEYYVLSKHKAQLPINQLFYPNFKNSAKKFITNLEHEEVIDCLIVRMNKTKDCFILKLLIEPKN